jgi:hypothetical protein
LANFPHEIDERAADPLGYAKRYTSSGRPTAGGWQALISVIEDLVARVEALESATNTGA